MGWFSRKTAVNDRKAIRLIVETTVWHRQAMGMNYSSDIVEKAIEAAMSATGKESLIDALQKCIEDDEAKHANLMPGAYALQGTA